MTVKKYFDNEFQWSMFSLEHDTVPDFYLGCWQKNRSCVPLLVVRGFLCALNIAVVVASMVILAEILNGHGYWWIYLTHWGIIANTLTTMFAFGLSVRVYLRGPLDSIFGLPWYVKAYWFLYNASVPMAFLITIFYWIFISGSDLIEPIDLTLDIFLHGVNSGVMLIMLLTTRHPTRILHFHHVVVFAILYLVFNIIYYYAGGTDSSGNVWVYPMLDWSNPGVAGVVTVGVAIALIVIHGLVVLMTLCRNYYSRRYRKEHSFSVTQ